MKRKKIAIFLLMGAIFLTGCGQESQVSTDENQANAVETSSESENSSDDILSEIDASEMFTDRDKEIGYDEENSAVITLSDDYSSCNSDAVEIDGNTVTIVDEGTYILSGVLKNGMVIVDAEDTDKVQIVLDGVDITSAESAAIYVRSADKVFLTTSSGSENVLTNGGT